MEKLYNIFFTELRPSGTLRTKTIGPREGMTLEDATKKLEILQSSAIDAGDPDYAEGLSIDEYKVETELLLR